jgi:hypothetical protein
MGGAEQEREMEARIEIVNVGADTARTMMLTFVDLDAAHAFTAGYPGAYWTDLQVADDGVIEIVIAIE